MTGSERNATIAGRWLINLAVLEFVTIVADYSEFLSGSVKGGGSLRMFGCMSKFFSLRAKDKIIIHFGKHH